jgi:hypothetical protein
METLDLNPPDSESVHLFLEGESVALLLTAWLYLNVLFAAPPFFYHLNTITIISLAVYKAVSNKMQMNWFPILCIALSIIIPSAVNTDVKGLVSAFLYFGGLIGLFVLFFDKHISFDILWKAFIYIVIPVYLISVLIVGEGPRYALQSNPPTLIPQDFNAYKVNIGPWGTTVHFSAEIALLLFVSCFLSDRIKMFGKLRWIYGVFASYLIVFSGARTMYLSLVLILIVYLLGRKGRFDRMLFMILLISGSIYLLNLITVIPYQFEGVVGQLTKLNENTSDFSSGRIWLWTMHMDQFALHPIFGTGRAGLDALFQNWDLDILPATSESFYTAQLATYGIFGTIFILTPLYILNTAIKLKNTGVVILLGHAFLGTVLNSTYGQISYPFQILIISLTASMLNGKPFIKSKFIIS